MVKREGSAYSLWENSRFPYIRACLGETSSWMRKNRWITYPVFSSFARATLQGTTKSTGKAGRKHRSVVTRWMAKPASCPPTLLGHVPLVVTYANPHITEEWTGRAGEAEGQRHRAIHCSPIREPGSREDSRLHMSQSSWELIQSH